jgi:hypothetical protein
MKLSTTRVAESRGLLSARPPRLIQAPVGASLLASLSSPPPGPYWRHGRDSVQSYLEARPRLDAAAFPPELSCIGRRFRRLCGERCWPAISKPLLAASNA